MRQWLRSHLSYANVMVTLLAFVVLGGGTAWAVNEWTGANIVDSSLTSADYKNNDIRSADIKDFSLGNGDFLTGSVDSRVATDDSLTSADIKNFSLGNGDLVTGSVDSRAVTDNSLTGSDIQESTLAPSDQCHAGAVLLGRLCAGSDGVKRTIYQAFNFCASIGLRLPTWGEAELLAINHDVPGVTPGGVNAGEIFWTDDTAYQTDTNGIWVTYVDEAGNTGTTSAQTTIKTVCVETPTDVP